MFVLFESLFYVRPSDFGSLFIVRHVIGALIMTSIEQMEKVLNSSVSEYQDTIYIDIFYQHKMRQNIKFILINVYYIEFIDIDVNIHRTTFLYFKVNT